MKKPILRTAAEAGLLALIVTLTVLLFWRFCTREFGYHLYETASVHYLRGEVTKLVDQDLTLSGADGEYFTGTQVAEVTLASGETVEIVNYVTVQHNVVLREGGRVIVCADTPEGAEPYYTIYNYDRAGGILLCAGLFLLLVLAVGRKKGLMSGIALLFTLAAVVCFMLPSLYEGQSATLTALLTVVASTAVTCFCIGGLTRKTALNILSSSLGCLSAGLLFLLFAHILSVTGTTADEADSLSLIAGVTGLRLHGVLLCSVLVSALGAVMDVAVSLGAALSEIKDLNPAITAKELFRSGMNIGRDMIGTMTNTLILAFAGSSLATLLLFVSYGVQLHQVLSSDFLALEIAKGLAGSAAVVLTVPIGAAVCAVGLSLSRKPSVAEIHSPISNP